METRSRKYFTLILTVFTPIQVCRLLWLSVIMATVEAWGELGQRYKIHEETLQFFRTQSERDTRPYTELSVAEAMETNLNTALYFCGDVEFKGSSTDFTVPSLHCQDGIPVTVYKDSICPLTAPIFIYFHGGGMVLCSRKSHEVVCKVIARDTPCIVVNVEYRLAPEHKCPAQFDDAECVTRWVIMNKSLIGGSNASRVGVGGDSAGGTLATSVCHYVNVDFQVLVYPMTDYSCSQPSFTEFANAGEPIKPLSDWFGGHFLASKDQITDPRVSPLLQNDFSRLPPALFVLAELDPLVGSGYAYRDQMSSAGVHTETIVLRGVPHAFFHIPGHYKENCGKANQAIINFIRKFGR